MDEALFEAMAAEEWKAVPEHLKRSVENVALLVEDEPSEALRKEENLSEHETLLGLYQGVPNSARGENYGIGATLPDTITLFRLPILAEAERLMEEDEKNLGGREGESREAGAASPRPSADYIRRAIRETLWHELGHYFGYDDDALHHREHEGTNRF